MVTGNTPPTFMSTNDEIESLRERIADLIEKNNYLLSPGGMAELRAVNDEPCQHCAARGIVVYGSTATWRRGAVGGMAMTPGPCNRCWGSGSSTHPWPSHELHDTIPRCVQCHHAFVMKPWNKCVECLHAEAVAPKPQLTLCETNTPTYATDLDEPCHCGTRGRCLWALCPQMRPDAPAGQICPLVKNGYLEEYDDPYPDKWDDDDE